MEKALGEGSLVTRGLQALFESKRRHRTSDPRYALSHRAAQQRAFADDTHTPRS